MLFSYVKIILRTAKKHPFTSAINLLGLTLGVATGILVILFAIDEQSYDRFHKNGDHIYRVVSDIHDYGTDELIGEIETNGWAIGEKLRTDFQEVQALTYARSASFLKIHREGRIYSENMHFVEPSFFDIFSFHMINGDPKTALNEPYSMVLTEDMAAKYFPDQNALGKTMFINDSLAFSVTGVLENVPSQSHIQFDILVSFSTYPLFNSNFTFDGGWGNYNVRNYLLLDPNADLDTFREKAASIYMDNVGDWMQGVGWRSLVGLEPLHDIYLKSSYGNGFGPTGSMDKVWLVMAIAVFVIVLACVNFINLTTARSLERAREAGLRKVVGSTRSTLMWQFLAESFVTTVIAFLLALFVVTEFLPVFNSIMSKDYSIVMLASLPIMGSIALMVLLVAFAAGYYPAIVLSSFKPADVLKGKLQSHARGSRLRKVLVVVQFTISASMIIGTFAVQDQMEYMRKQDLGFNKDRVVVMHAGHVPRGVLRSQSQGIKNELLSHSSVRTVTFTGALPGRPGWRGQLCFPEGFPEGESVTVEYDPVDLDYVQTMGLEVIAGRNFDPERKSDLDEGLLINEMAVQEMRWESPENAIGKTITSPSGSPQGTVIGVVKNYHQMGLQSKIRPIVLDHFPDPNYYFAVAFSASEASEIIALLENTWKSQLEAYDFQYFFLDEDFERQYEREEQLSNVFSLFSGMTIFIAITGFLGLITYMVISRRKEMGIRKVLGASVPSIVISLSKEFMLLIVLACGLTIPVGWYGISLWLEGFAYQNGVNTMVFVITFAGIFILTATVIAFQAIRAARVNPVNVLRVE